MLDWITAPLVPDLAGTLLSAAALYALVIALTRLVGLRSFAKMSSFDFAMTVAVGSALASALLTKDPALVQAAVGLGAIFGLQHAVGWLRARSPMVQKLVDNEPVLLMVEGRFLHENMRRARVTEDDMWSKLRGAGVTSTSSVLAVVMETTGDVSVISGGGELEPEMLRGVRDAEGHFPTAIDDRPDTEEVV